MSFGIQLSALSIDRRKEILKDLIITPNKTQYNQRPDSIHCYHVDKSNDILYLPLGLWHRYLSKFPNHHFPKIDAIFTKSLLTKETDLRHRDQDQVVVEALKLLKSKHTYIHRAAFINDKLTKT